MPLVLSHVLDLRTAHEARRLDLHDRFPRLGSLDLYLRRAEIEGDERDLAGLLDPAFQALRPLAGRLDSVRVFHPPYAPRMRDGGYDRRALGEIERVAEVASRLREVTRSARAGVSFHHVTEWLVGRHAPRVEDAPRQLAVDRARGLEFAGQVASRCAARGVAALLENVAPVRNDHAFAGARLLPRFETGFTSPRELRRACDAFPSLGVVLDLCHLALGCEARRVGRLPLLNELEAEGDTTFDEDPPYRFEQAIELLAHRLECVHLSGCLGPEKALHEGGVPGAPGDRIDLAGCLALLERAARARPLAVTIEVGDAHTDAGFPRLVEGLENASAALTRLETG